jgi:hypothetical protein
MHGILVGEPDKIGSPGIPSCRWEANVKMDIQEIEK